MVECSFEVVYVHQKKDELRGTPAAKERGEEGAPSGQYSSCKLGEGSPSHALEYDIFKIEVIRF